MPRKSNWTLPKKFEGLDLSLSGLAIIGLVAILHMTSAGIDLIEAARAAVIGPEHMIQLMDIAVGSGLALFPYIRARLRRAERQRDNRPADASY